MSTIKNINKIKKNYTLTSRWFFDSFAFKKYVLFYRIKIARNQFHKSSTEIEIFLFIYN